MCSMTWILYDTIYVHYYCTEQIHTYREYQYSTQVTNTTADVIVMDATYRPRKNCITSVEKTNSLYLYENAGV